jgi:hypothetical protein
MPINGMSDILKRAQWSCGTGDDGVWRGFDQDRRQFAGMLSISLEAIRNHHEILAFAKAVAAQFIE